MNRVEEDGRTLATVVALLFMVGAVLVAAILLGVMAAATMAAILIPAGAYGPVLARALRIHVTVWRFSRRLRRW